MTADGALDASPMLRYIMAADKEALAQAPRGVGSKVLFIRLEQGQELPPLAKAQVTVADSNHECAFAPNQTATGVFSVDA